ncbi:hypothetical protein OnM2_080058 [Erysiphe neolycopersici]|uniref:Uncharacterized protein n=1 Tax=Erysiphe neolycopersici TaxID=212602 RepID=A0A420HGI8_9PEZI|nr:hypothetical protein OnM2_080058 [Erysiphe neolycopersici]
MPPQPRRRVEGRRLPERSRGHTGARMGESCKPYNHGDSLLLE